MIYYKLGDVIRELRSRLHMTQEELAAGICSVSSIAKIENGSQMPSGRVAEALLRRLKDVGCFFTGFSTVQELEELGSWERTLFRAHSERAGSSLFEEQFYAYVRVLEHMQWTTNHELLLLELMEVLVMSLPLGELYEETARRRTYTYLELYLFNSIAIRFFYMDSADTAECLLARVCTCLKQWHPVDGVGRYLYPVVCNNLAAVKASGGLLRPAHAVCEDGIRACLDAGLLQPLPQLYGTLRNILFALQEQRLAQQADARMRALTGILKERRRTLTPPEQQLIFPEQQLL